MGVAAGGESHGGVVSHIGVRRRATTAAVASALVLTAVAVVPIAAQAGSAPLVRPHQLAPEPAPAGSAALGSVPAGQPLQLSVVLPPSHQDQLTSLLAGLRTPTSPDYRHWMAPGQFQRRFGPSPTAVAQVVSWLHSVGLDQTSVAGFAVHVTGRASQLSSGLGTSFERYRTPNGHVGYRSQQTPLVPATLAAGQVTSILGLDTVTTFTTQEAPPAPRATGSVAVRPHDDGLTACPAALAAAGSNFYTLDSLGAAYGLGALLSNGQDGQGQTIGVYELGSSSSTDVSTYLNCFGLTSPVSTDPVDGGAGAVGGNGTEEADIDIDQTATQAPKASIISYEGPNSPTGAYDTWNTIISADAAQVVSTSWGVCEPIASAENETSTFSTLFEEAAAQGQTVVAASGDSGSEGCDPSNQSTAPAVLYPASDPSVTAVGGTALLGPGNEQGWSYSGGGLSAVFPDPAWQPADWTWQSAQACGTQCREVPDLSANAGVGMVVYDNGAWAAVAGTSLSAPFIAGLVADRNVGCTAPSGDLAPTLYAAAGEGLYGTGLTDILLGDNDATNSNNGAFFPVTQGYDPVTGLGSPLASGLSCPEVTGVTSGYPGTQVTVSGLGLEHASVTFGSSPAEVVSATATAASVVVPTGAGTVTVRATGTLGAGTLSSSFTYGTAPAPTPATTAPSQHGYWLVAADGGIFTFGSATFHGSTGNLALQRPVVGITPTSTHGGYWLDASDGGVFAFGNAGFYGSIPGLGFAPAGSPGSRPTLNAPVVGMVPSADGKGYFMVAADGGVFAFGDARYAGSCPGIGGCVGAAVAVMPDATGSGYWVVTNSGNVYPFGDAANLGGPGSQGSVVTSAVRTPDGGGYWILFADGKVTGFGDAADLGGPVRSVNGSDPAAAIMATADGGGYWVSTAAGAVYTYGDAPYGGGMGGVRLNAPVIAATGW